MDDATRELLKRYTIWLGQQGYHLPIDNTLAEAVADTFLRHDKRNEE